MKNNIKNIIYNFRYELEKVTQSVSVGKHL